MEQALSILVGFLLQPSPSQERKEGRPPAMEAANAPQPAEEILTAPWKEGVPIRIRMPIAGPDRKGMTTVAFSSLLEGLIEHFFRRRLRTAAPLDGLEGLVAEVRDAMRAALDLCRGAVEEGGLEEHMRRTGGRNLPSPTSEASPTVPNGLRAIGEETPAPTRRSAG